MLVILNTLIISIIRISFSLGKEIVVLGKVEVETYFGIITFYILPVNTLFLLYLKDIDRLGIIFNNTRNRISSGRHFEVVEKAMRALREVSARRQVNEAITTRNRPNIGGNLDILLNLDV
ncbi:hypothetical protein CCUS01_07423 [Colletotrichum cuscutae]|uniref:Uncharacterized protein n=1 Tax=Colletotrichum cuscutae TaxID=1209917 RepID=A0AAI9UX11_9PEZI|nr:hypothetical protein CCUS01_07423 [Colletotrichum cuscutae]